jgi:hypothetical protein
MVTGEIMNKCALMGCDLEDEDLTLAEIIKQYPNSKACYQAQLLITKYGFEETDIFCLDCFWK